VREDLGTGGTAAALRLPYLADALAAAEAVPAEGPLKDRRLAVMGEAHNLAGRTEQAVAAWQAAALGDPPTAEQKYARERLAHALYRLGRHRDSAAAYESVGNRRGAAAAWGAAREAEKALALYASLLAEAPGDAVLMADALAVARFAGGQERLDAILAGMSGTGERAAAILRARARLAEQKKDFAGALTHLRAARAALPALSPALAADIGRVLIRGGTGGQAAREEAAAVLLEAWKTAPGEPGLRDLMLAIAAQEFSDAWRAWPDRRPLERSVALQTAVLRSAKDDPLAWANLGNTLRLAGDAKGAAGALNDAVILAPEDAAAWNDLGLAWSAAGQPEEALGAFRRAVAADEAFLAARQNLGRALWRQGDDAGAAGQLAAAERSARATGASWMLYRVLANRAWRTQHRPERR
jgi:tetratricopeptide (TPR) repeat protein